MPLADLFIEGATVTDLEALNGLALKKLSWPEYRGRMAAVERA